MHNFTLWILFISRINRAQIYKGLNDSHRQRNNDLAHLVEYWSDDQDVVCSNPTGAIFDEKKMATV